MLKKNVNRILSILLALGLLVSLGISGMAANGSPQGEDTSVEIVFVGNGGTPENQTVQVKIGARYADAFAEITPPVKYYVLEGEWGIYYHTYTFIGWFSTPKGDGVQIHGTEYIQEYHDTLESPRTLYARWRSATYWDCVSTFCGNGGTPEFQWIRNHEVRGATFAEAFALLEEPTKQGHAFLGWYCIQGSGGEGNDVINIICSTQGFFCGTFKAKWLLLEDSSVEIVFLGNGGTPERQTVQIASGARYAEAFAEITTPTKYYVYEWQGEVFVEPYTFIGWFTTPRGDGVQIHGTDYIPEYQDPEYHDTLESPRTLYARWGGVGDCPLVIFMFFGNGGIPEVQGFCCNRSSGITFAEAFAMIEEPTKPRHAFLGWYSIERWDGGLTGPTHLICSTQGFFGGHFNAKWLLWGDVNGDGRVDSLDLNLLQRHLNVGHIIPVPLDLRAADVVFDGRVDSSDLTLLQRFLNVGHLIPIELGLPPR